MQVASQCGQDVSFQSADISTIAPDITALGHQSTLGVSGMTTDASDSHLIAGHHSSMLAGTHYSQPTLHEASFGTSAPPQPSLGPPGLFGAKTGSSVPLQPSPGHFVAQAGTVAPAPTTSHLAGGPPGPFGAQTGTVAPAPMTSHLAGMAPGVQSFVPADVTPHFQVFQEDFHNADMINPGNNPPRALAVGAKSLEAVHTRDIYVQPMTETARFKPVPVQQMRRAFGHAKQVEEPQQINVRRSALWKACAAVDADIAQLQARDRLDLDILELLATSLRNQISTAEAFWTCQALLAGLSIIAGLVALSGDDEKLKNVLEILEPGFGNLKLILAQLTCVGNALRLFWTWEKVSAMRADGLDESSAEPYKLPGYNFTTNCTNITNSTDEEIDAEMDGRFTASFLPFGCYFTSNVTRIWKEGPDLSEEWSANFTRSLLWTQTFLGILALIFSGSGVLDLTKPLEGTHSAEMVDEGQYSNR